MTHEEYLDEPAQTIDWLLALAKMEGDIQADRMKRARAEQAQAARRRP